MTKLGSFQKGLQFDWVFLTLSPFMQGMPFLLAEVDWIGLVIFSVMTVAMGCFWLALVYGVYLVLRNFFREVRKHGR